MFCRKCGKELNNGANACPNCGTKPTSGKSIISIFNDGKNAWRGETTDYDCVLYPIPEDIKSAARLNYGIGYNEQILFVRDTSFWNSKDQGLVLTDEGVYCIADNEKKEDIIHFTWEIIKQVEYKDLVLYFGGYGSNDDYCPISISYFIKNDDNIICFSVGNALARLFSSIAQSVEPEADPYDVAFEKWKQLLFVEGKKNEALQFALSCKEKEGMERFYMIIAHMYLEKGEHLKIISICDEGLQFCEHTSPMETRLLYYKYSAYHALNNDIEARKYCLPVSLNALEDMQRSDGMSIKEDATNDFNIYEQKYISNYLELPYNKRKVLLPVNEYIDLCQDYLSVIDIKRLPETNIEFPIGHPIIHQLYIGHPYIKQKYIPFENYELELIEDKVREFCQIAQSLGATEITIECINSTSNDKSGQTEQNMSGEVSYKIASASGSGKKQGSQRLMDEISQSINLHQKYEPKGIASLPEKLVWFPNEPSWQRLYEQRMKGTLLQHEERIETRKNRVLERSELNSIEGEFKSLFMGAKGHWDKINEEKLILQENVILSIRAHFASLEELQQMSTSYAIPLLLNSLTVEEQEYMEELKSCMEACSEISAGERRLLEKLRKHLGISEQRAEELEESLKLPPLTNDEKEYLEEYRFCLEDGNGISDKERRLLNKLRDRLNISEERIKEIERL